MIMETNISAVRHDLIERASNTGKFRASFISISGIL